MTILRNVREWVVLVMVTMGWILSSDAIAGEKGFHLSTGIMALTNSTTQGGEGPSGSTILTQSELIYHGSWWGLGGFFQWDKQGTAQTDIGYGPKLELHWNVFYVEGGYLFGLNQSFTDRTIESRSGDGWLLGVGTRFMLGGSQPGAQGGAGGFFLQFSYKYRIQNITKESDGSAETILTEPITQKDGYPLMGIGFLF